MAIINTPKQEEKEEVKAEGIIKSSTSAPQGSNSKSTGSRDVDKPGVKVPWMGIGLVSLVAVIAAAIYFGRSYMPDFEQAQAKPTMDAKVVTLDIERMVRIGGLMDLLEKKIAQAEIAIDKAKKLDDQVLVDTMRLGLARNLEDLNKHQDEFIAGLNKLYDVQQHDPEGLATMLKSTLKKSEDVYKVGNVETINDIMKLLKSVPENTKPSEYFKEKVKKQT